MKTNQSELTERRLQQLLSDPNFLENTHLSVREKLIVKMVWHDNKTLEEVTVHFGLKRERTRQILEKAARRIKYYIIHAAEFRAKQKEMEKEIEELKNTVEAYRLRFEALKKKDDLKSQSKKPVIKDFGDIKILKIKVEELGFSDSFTWSLLSKKISNIAALLNETKTSLKEKGIATISIKKIEEALAKYNFVLKE